jgi:glycosyltransferase involved in cell wall biosynthesis
MALKILFSESSPNLGGQELQLLQQMITLKQRGVAVKLACRPASGIYQAASQRGLELVPIAFRNSLHPPSILRVRRLLQDWQPDVVVSHSGHDANVCGVAAHLVSSMRHQPRMVRVRTYQHDVPHAWSYNWLADMTLVPSQEMRARILRNPRIQPARIHVLYPGLDFAAIARDAQQALPESVAVWLAQHPGRLIAHAAMLRPEKGHLMMLDVLARLLPRFPDSRYVIAGEGEQRTAIEARVRELGITENVCMAGMLQPVAPLLQRAQLAIMPSLIEPLGMAQIEALSLGVAVVASNVDGIPETIEAGQTGLLVAPGAIVAWVDAIAWALDHPERMAEMAAAGRARVLEKFSIEANIARFLALIQAGAASQNEAKT